MSHDRQTRKFGQSIEILDIGDHRGNTSLCGGSFLVSGRSDAEFESLRRRPGSVSSTLSSDA
ncbi:hypothetical protein BDZ89DRAFT_1069210, partial [Hymenopellis radicata]